MKFTKFSKYASSLVSTPRSEMNHFSTGVYYDLIEEYLLVMLHENMEISRLMVYAYQFYESSLKRKIKDARNIRSYERGTSKGG